MRIDVDISENELILINRILRSKTMTDLVDAMKAVAAVIKANQVDPAHLAAIDASIKALQDHDAAEDPVVADAIAAMQALHDGVVPAPAPADPAA